MLTTLLAVSPAPDGVATTAFTRLVRTRAMAPKVASGTLISNALSGTTLTAPGVVAPTAPAAPVATGLPTAVSDLLVDTAAQNAVAFQWRTRQTLIQSVTTALSAQAVAGLPRLFKVFGVPPAAAPTLPTNSAVVPVPVNVATSIWQGAFTPTDALRLRVNSMLTTSVPGTTPSTDQLQPVLPTPQVGAALALGMKERDPSWLIAGIGAFPNECATLLRPDRAFIESALLGANHALLDKYLWRGFPTDRRGTPIQHFWPGPQPDITPIHQWQTGSTLGSHPPTLPPGWAPAQTFMLIRSLLFQRYPDTIVTAVPAVVSSTAVTPDLNNMIPPSLPMIALDATTRLIGFPIADATISAATPTPTTPGCFFLLLQPPTGLRFGFEPTETPWPHLDANGFIDVLTGPGSTFFDSSALASGAVLRTVRAILHSSRMVGAQS
jgi:hypothetical protein